MFSRGGRRGSVWPVTPCVSYLRRIFSKSSYPDSRESSHHNKEHTPHNLYIDEKQSTAHDVKNDKNHHIEPHMITKAPHIMTKALQIMTNVPHI